MCNTYNLRVTQGDIISRTMTFKDRATGDPYDLTIYNAIKMQVRKKPGSTVIAQGTLAAGNFVISGVDNNVLEMSGIEIPGDTPVGVYMYDIEFSNADQDIKETLIEGNITVIAQISI